MATMQSVYAVAVVLALSCLAAPSAAQVVTGQNRVCCAYILNTANTWQLVCNNPAGIPGAMPFPSGTIISGVNFVNGQIAQCVGRFPFPNPAPFRLPPTGQQLFAAPNGGRCAGQFLNFYQGLGPDGGFVVQCTGAARASLTARANRLTTMAGTADPAAVAAPTDGAPMPATSGAELLVPMANMPPNVEPTAADIAAAAAAAASADVALEADAVPAAVDPAAVVAPVAGAVSP